MEEDEEEERLKFINDRSLSQGGGKGGREEGKSGHIFVCEEKNPAELLKFFRNWKCMYCAIPKANI